MIETLNPQQIAPLTPDITDEAVISGKTNDEKPKLLCDSDEAKAIILVLDHYDRQEEFVRITLVKRLRKLMHYWNNLQYLAWDELNHDWKTAEEVIAEDPQNDLDPALYAKIVNVYKAHGEILIGALTADTPRVRFFPANADDTEDTMAAKARSRLAELIQKQNRARLLLMKALFVLYNQGMVACYNEQKADYRFGKLEIPEYSETEMMNRDHFCPSCGESFGQEQFPAPQPPAPPQAPVPGQPPQLPMAPQQPDPGPVMSQQTCPQCNQMVQPDYQDMGTETVKQQTGVRTEPKNRECLEIYGPLNVKVPVHIKEQSASPYLILETEEHVAYVREIYPEIADKIESSAFPDSYDKEARVPSQYRSDFPRDICTVQRVWFRPWAFNLWIRDGEYVPEELGTIRAECPKGIYAVVINRTIVAEIVEDALDEHWTLSENPLSEILHAEPIGAAMVPLQDITNELANLTLETIEFGIPEVFADSRVIDFDNFSRQESRPGQISPATVPSGGSMQTSFYTIKAATLSREVESFADRIQNVSQFVMGSYPSIYGGTQEGGGGTAKEYELSKASALQRLSLTWTITQEFWCKVIKKAVDSFVKHMKADEVSVQAKGAGFVNVWIKRAELSGDVGDVEPEISETFPVSWSQKRDVILNLIQMQNEDIAAVIRHPENAGLIANIVGVPELFIPGNDSRDKQLYEISKLIQTEPMEMPPSPVNPTGMQSSVPIDPELDDNKVEGETCRAWLTSPVGQDAKENNPAGYANVLAHMKEHQQAEQMQAMQAMPPPGASAPPGGPDQMTENMGA